MTAPNLSVTAHYVIPHICLSMLSTLHSHLLTIRQSIPSFFESHHMDLYKTPPMIPTGLIWDFIINANQVDSRDDVIRLTISPLSWMMK